MNLQRKCILVSTFETTLHKTGKKKTFGKINWKVQPPRGMKGIQQRKAGGIFPRNKHLTWHLNYKMNAGFKKRKKKKL